MPSKLMTKRTNKKILEKGLKTMVLTLVLLFLGPTLIYIAFSNQEKPLYIPILVGGIIVSGAAIYFGFKGIKTIMDSLFEPSSSD